MGTRSVSAHSVEGNTACGKDDVFRPQVRIRLFGVCHHLAVRVLQQPGRPRIVGVYHAGDAVSEQDSLGVAVVFHGLMEIQMILSQIGKDTHIVPHAVDPVQIQSVGGRLHHHMGAACIPPFPGTASAPQRIPGWCVPWGAHRCRSYSDWCRSGPPWPPPPAPEWPSADRWWWSCRRCR